MTRFSVTTQIPAPPDRVWAVLADVERWHEWTSTITSITRMDKGPLVVGSRARIRQPRLRPAVWEVTEIRPGRGFTWMTSSPGVRVVGQHEIEPAGEGTRATLTIRFSGLLGPIVARLTRRLNQEYLAIEAEGLGARSIRPA